MSNIDLTGITALITAASALASLAVMQIVTKESGFRRGTSRLRLCQRFSLAALSIALGYDCYDALTTGADPRVGDLVVHGALFWVLTCWAYLKMWSNGSSKFNSGTLSIFNHRDYS